MTMTRLNAVLTAVVLPVGSAVSGTRFGRARDLPLLTDLVFDVCGAGSFDFTPSSPCPYAIFGVAVAWSECGDAYESSFSGFRSCLGSCATPNTCERACSKHAPGEPRKWCALECQALHACIDETLTTSTGLVSAETNARNCFKDGAKKQPPYFAPASFLAIRAPKNAAPQSTSNKVFKRPADYAALFPEGCELLGESGSPWRRRLPVPPEPIGHGSGPLRLATPAPPQPRLEGALRSGLAALESATTPLPASWHQARLGIFEQEVPQLQVLPPAIDTGSNWMQEAEESMPECAQTVSVMGLEFTEHRSRMGTFEMTYGVPFVHNAGRPVYRSSNGQYLYYWDSLKAWRIGDDYKSAVAGVTSTAGLATECPTQAQGWAAWVGGAWSAKRPVKVVAA